MNNSPNIEIKIANNESIVNLKLCAKDFLDFINNFEKKFQKNKFFILTAYYESVLAGILVSEDKNQKIDSLTKIVPLMCIHLIYVNPKYRHKNIGKNLLLTFINIQKEKGVAALYIKLPQKFKSGIDFFMKNNFHQKEKAENNLILEFNLWNDYGIIDYNLIGNNHSNIFE